MTAATVIAPLTVDNTYFLVDRLHRDCSSTQYVRELFKNALEATEAAIQSGLTIHGDICIDIDDICFARSGVRKFCITDNGVGMAPSELEHYINHLAACGGKTQSMQGNFGLGAKIATLPANPLGVIYESWQRGEGHSVTAIKTADGRYGLECRVLHDGLRTSAVPLDSLYRPLIGPDACIGDNGTKVVLLGKHEADDTFTPPAGSGLPAAHWLSAYLNARFFELPLNIRVRVREGIDGTDEQRYQIVTGMRTFLNTYSINYGTVTLSNALAHWWILPAELQTDGRYPAGGHAALLYQSELYDKAERRGISARLQQFGISFGWDRVVIYIEPDPTSELTTNAARTRMIVNGGDAPWAEWAHEFRARLPRAIKKLIERSMPGDNETGESIRDRLNQVKELYHVSRYRRHHQGSYHVASTHGSAPVGEIKLASAYDGPSRLPDSAPLNRRDNPILPEKAGGDRAHKVHQIPLPLVKWISFSDGTRQKSYIEDRAAKYLPEVNHIHVNADFRGFIDVVDYWDRQYAVGEGPDQARRAIIVQGLKSWYGQQLIEAVIGILQLQGSALWTDEQIAAALSEEALTAVAMQRFHLINASRRDIQTLLGKLIYEAVSAK